MRLLLAAALAASFIAAPSRAVEISLKLDDGAQSALAQLPAMLDSCVAALALRNEPASCRQMSVVMAALSNELRNAHAAAAKAAAEESAKKVAEDAAKAPAIPSPPAGTP